MGFPAFAKFFRYGMIAAVALAAAVVAALAVATPAAARTGGGGGGFGSLKPWDTDNLRYENYNAKSFNIPFHKYGGYSGVTACQKNVADGFFQTDNSVVNDFPRLVPSGRGDSVRWSVAAGSAGNNAGCDRFVAQQNRLAAQVASGVGHVLDENGNLVVAPSGAAYTTGRSASDLSYGSWTAKAASGYTLVGSYGGTSDRSYLARADGHTENRRYRRAISPDTATWTVPSRDSSSTGNFGALWHGTKLVTTTNVPGRWTGGKGHYECSGSWYTTSTGSRRCNGTQRWVWTVYQTWVPPYSYDTESDVRVALGNVAYHLTKAKSVALCPSLFHPRGEDSYQRIGRSTGRSLTGLSHTVGRTADRFWCRSDLRYERRFAVEIHDLPDGIIAYAGAPASGTFTAYGRLGCYYTATAPKLIKNSTRAYECGYRFPMPRCDSNRDGRPDREYTAAEIRSLVRRGTIALGQRVSLADTARCDPPNPPPTQASFTADACVTADLEIYENRIAGSEAEPGVPASDRTLAVAAGRTAWDLDVTSPHPLTASPPRDATSGTGDPDGCADGSESRADHASSPAGAARSQSPAPSYAASGRTDDAAPPNDADDDIDYSGAARNMAHRYASRVAENTCAAKRAEVGLRLALLEAEEKLYKDWMERYKAWAKGKKDAFGNWRPTGYPSGTIDTAAGSHSTFNSFKHAVRSQSRLNYATSMSTMYGTRETDAGAAAATSLAKPTVGASWCGDPAGFVKTYSTSVDNLKKAAKDAIKAGGSPASPSGGPTANITKAPRGTSVEKAGTAAEYGLEKRTRDVPDPDCDSSDSSSGSEDSDSEDSGDSSEETCGTIEEEYWVRVVTKAEVKATVTHSYASYTLTVSGGGWSDNKTIAAATRTQTCSRWYTSSCPSAGTHPGHSYSDLVGTLPRTAGFPSTTGSPTKSVSSPALSKLLGKYYPSHADRADLKHSAAQTRNQAATNLGKLDKTESATITPTAFSNLAVPVSNPATDTEETTQRNAVETAAEKYQDEYTKAYDNAYDQAIDDMGDTTTTVRRNGQTETVEVWSDFDWRYQTSTLTWSNYQEDPATTYSASTATPRDGTGCDLVSVASDGTVSVEATRLDYETSSYGKGSVYGVRTDAQRTCKIRRTRTPELLLMYAPAAPPTCTAARLAAKTVCGTDTTKTADSRLDTNEAKTNAEFYYVDYQPQVAAGQPAAERFKLYDEAEVFAVKASLSDSPPVFCASNVPSTVYVSHAAGAMSDMSAAIAAGRLYSSISTDVLRPAGYSAGPPPTDHCFSGAFANTANVKIAVFDDTAHSAMNLVYLEKDPADTSQITLLATGGALTADPAVAYPGDSAQNSRFYGATYSVPGSLGSSAGWDILGDNNPNTDLNTKIKNRIVARDKQAAPNLPAVPADTNFKHVSAMSFNIGFLDCRPDIENVVFIGNIVSATAASNQANDYAGITSASGYPMDAPQWYYPPWSEIKGKTRSTDGSTVTIGPNSKIFTHPQSARYGWVIETVNNIATDKQPISAFRNVPDVKRDNSARPADVTLEEHRQVCFGDPADSTNIRNHASHYRSAAAATDPLGHNTDASPTQAIVVWTEHNPLCHAAEKPTATSSA